MNEVPSALRAIAGEHHGERDVDPRVPVGQQRVGPDPGAGAGASSGGGRAHRTLQRRRPPRSSLAARCRTGRPPVSVTRLVPAGSTTIPKRRTSGGNAAARAQEVGELGVGTADEEGEAGVAGQLGGLPAGLDDAAVAEVGAADRVEREVAVGSRRTGRGVRAADEGDVELVEHRAHGDRRRDRHRRLEVVGVGPGREPVVHHDRGVAAARVEVLPDQQGRLAGGGHHLRRRAPVDVAQVVTGDVLAEGVEGQVALADRVGGDSLEVSQEAGAERLHRDEVRAHQHLAHRRPHHVAGEDADRVAAPGHGRADRDHAAPLGADGERLLVRRRRVPAS